MAVAAALAGGSDRAGLGRRPGAVRTLLPPAGRGWPTAGRRRPSASLRAGSWLSFPSGGWAWLGNPADGGCRRGARVGLVGAPQRLAESLSRPVQPDRERVRRAADHRRRLDGGQACQVTRVSVSTSSPGSAPSASSAAARSTACSPRPTPAGQPRWSAPRCDPQPLLPGCLPELLTQQVARYAEQPWQRLLRNVGQRRHAIRNVSLATSSAHAWSACWRVYRKTLR